MAVRQYIGARYTTKIYQNSLDPGSCEWEAGVVYEPLTIVSYQNSSYLSRSEVPANAGNPASATSYWAQTGFYNGQIANLDSRLTAAEGEIEDLQAFTTTKRYIIISDSLGNYTNNDGDTFPEIARKALGISTDNWESINQSSYGFHDNGFLSLLQSSTIEDKDTVTDIIVFCGWNDRAYLSGLSSNIQTFMTYAKANFPNATVSIGIDVWSPFKQPDDEFRDLVSTFQSACLDNNVRYIPYCNAALHDSNYYLSDGIHPTQASGVDALGRALTLAIKNGSGYYVSHTQFFATDSSFSTLSGYLTYRAKGNVLEVNALRSGTINTIITLVSAVSLSYDTYTKIAEMTRSGWSDLSGWGCITVPVTLISADYSTVKYTMADITIQENEMLLKIASGDETLSNIKYIKFNSFTRYLDLATN